MNQHVNRAGKTALVFFVAGAQTWEEGGGGHLTLGSLQVARDTSVLGPVQH